MRQLQQLLKIILSWIPASLPFLQQICIQQVNISSEYKMGIKQNISFDELEKDTLQVKAAKHLLLPQNPTSLQGL